MEENLHMNAGMSWTSKSELHSGPSSGWAINRITYGMCGWLGVCQLPFSSMQKRYLNRVRAAQVLIRAQASLIYPWQLSGHSLSTTDESDVECFFSAMWGIWWERLLHAWIQQVSEPWTVFYFFHTWSHDNKQCYVGSYTFGSVLDSHYIVFVQLQFSYISSTTLFVYILGTCLLLVRL